MPIQEQKKIPGIRNATHYQSQRFDVGYNDESQNGSTLMKTLSLSKFFLGVLCLPLLQNRHKIQKLPVLAIRLLSRESPGAHHPAFQYLSQDSTVVTNDSLANGIYIADFSSPAALRFVPE